MLTALCLFALTGNSKAQDADRKANLMTQIQQNRPGEGVVVIHQDAGIEEMMREHHDTNSRTTVLEGYRIQLYSGSGVNSKKEAMSVRIKFLGLFPNEAVDLYYNAPFWRVRVGNFRYRNEALPLLSKVKKQFPSSYLVKDNQMKKSDIK